MVDDVLTTSCWHPFRVLDGRGKEGADAIVAPRFLALAAWPTEAVFLYRVGTYEAYRLPVFGGARWRQGCRGERTVISARTVGNRLAGRHSMVRGRVRRGEVAMTEAVCEEAEKAGCCVPCHSRPKLAGWRLPHYKKQIATSMVTLSRRASGTLEGQIR